MRNRYIWVALAILACASVSACGGSSKSSHSSASTRQQPTTGPTTQTAAAPPTSHPLVTVDGVQHGVKPQSYRVSIYDLRRDGPYVVLDLGIVCGSSGCDTGSSFAPPLGGSESLTLNGLNEASGVTLVDPVNDKQYGVVYDAKQNPQASRLPRDSILDQSLHLAWVKFPAPPASVRALDVVFPNDGPQISNVPLSDSPAPLPTSLGPNGTAETREDNGAQPADSTSTAGMTLPVTNLITTAGNAAGSDAESAHQATITLRTDVLFKFAKSNLTPRAKTILTPLATKIKSRAVGPVQVTGYTDSIGTDQVNIPLSQARAGAVVAALKPALAGVTFHASGLGSSDPVAPNTNPNGSDNPAGRALNRRVTIAFAVKAPTPPVPPVSAPAASSAQAGASREVDFQVPGSQNHWQVAVDGLYREGNLAVMKLRISCAPGASQDCNGAEDFEGSENVPPVTFSQNFLAKGLSLWTLGGFYLTDPTTGTEYIPVHADDDPLAPRLNANMAPGESYPVWIYFAAPPSSTTAVTVSLPGGSPKIGNVPITTAPSPAGG